MQAIVDNFVVPECQLEIEILHHDEHFLLINKPTGLLSLSGKNPLNQDSVHFRLVQQFPSATMVHRLDLGTSGIMLVALNKAANINLAKQFQARSVSKSYISLLHGHLTDNSGTIKQPIAKDRQLFPRVKICQQAGKPAISDYVVIERLEEPFSTKVRYQPQTGRTHQLRVHSESIGHPIIGCDLYGTTKSYQAADRLMLHAETLTFDHPITGKRILAECTSPF